MQIGNIIFVHHFFFVLLMLKVTKFCFLQYLKTIFPFLLIHLLGCGPVSAPRHRGVILTWRTGLHSLFLRGRKLQFYLVLMHLV